MSGVPKVWKADGWDGQDVIPVAMMAFHLNAMVLVPTKLRHYLLGDTMLWLVS